MDKYQQILDSCEERMSSSFKNFTDNLKKIRTGRANPAMLDGINVDYYGTMTPVNQCCSITVEDSKTLIGMVKFLGFLTIIVVFSIFLGQKIVLPIFIFLFCRYWASLSLKISIIYCFLGWSILVSFYEYVLTIFWYPSLIGDFINSLYANNHLLRLLF